MFVCLFVCLLYVSPLPPETLPYLFQILFVLDEGLAPLILQLIFSALSGTPPIKEEVSTPEPESKSHASSRSARRKELEEHRKSKEKSKEKETKVSIVGEFIQGATLKSITTGAGPGDNFLG